MLGVIFYLNRSNSTYSDLIKKYLIQNQLNFEKFIDGNLFINNIKLNVNDIHIYIIGKIY